MPSNFFVYSFIRLADYLIVNTMHVLAANSVATLLNYLEEQLQHTPTPAQIQGTTEEKEDGEENPEGDGIEQKVYRSLTRYRRTIPCFKFDPGKLTDVWVILGFAFKTGSMLCPIALFFRGLGVCTQDTIRGSNVSVFFRLQWHRGRISPRSCTRIRVIPIRTSENVSIFSI